MLNNKHRSELVNTLTLNPKQVKLSNIPKGYHTEATSVVTKKGHAKTTSGCLFGTMDRPR